MKEKKSEKLNLAQAIKKSDYQSVWALLILSAFLIVVSLLMLAIPGMKESYYLIVGGFLLVLAGIWYIVVYFKKNQYMDLKSYGFALGVLLLMLGILALLRADDLGNNIYLILGVCMLAEGVMELQHSLQLKAMNTVYWYANLVMAGFTLVFTFLILMGFVDFADNSPQAMYGIVLAIGFIGIASMILVALRVRALKKALASYDAVSRPVEAEYVNVPANPAEAVPPQNPGGNAGNGQ